MLRTIRLALLLLCIPIPCFAFSKVTLEWDRVIQTGVTISYGIHYTEDQPEITEPCWPCFVTGASTFLSGSTASPNGQSPIVVPESGVTPVPNTSPERVQYQLTFDPPLDEVYFVVDARDGLGQKSDFSNTVGILSGGSPWPTDPFEGPPPPAEALRVLGYTSTPVAYPHVQTLQLDGSVPESAEVTMALNRLPLETVTVRVVVNVWDPDFVDEGRLFVNGTYAAALFERGSSALDAQTVDIIIDTDPVLWQLGDNLLTFWHDSTQGFIIYSIEIQLIVHLSQ